MAICLDLVCGRFGDPWSDLPKLPAESNSQLTDVVQAAASKGLGEPNNGRSAYLRAPVAVSSG